MQRCWARWSARTAPALATCRDQRNLGELKESAPVGPAGDSRCLCPSCALCGASRPVRLLPSGHLQVPTGTTLAPSRAELILYAPSSNLCRILSVVQLLRIPAAHWGLLGLCLPSLSPSWSSVNSWTSSASSTSFTPLFSPLHSAPIANDPVQALDLLPCCLLIGPIPLVSPTIYHLLEQQCRCTF